MPLGDLVDINEEISRLNKEIEKMHSEIKRGESKLNNQGFVSKAPEQLVESERIKLKDNIAMLETLEKRVANLKE